jgi:hypothetical protein
MNEGEKIRPENLRDRENFRHLDVDGKMMLKFMLNNRVWGCSMDSTGSG